MLIVYGKGVPAIAEDLHVDIEKAQEIKDSILSAFPDLKVYLDYVVEYCKKTGYVKTFYGRKRRLPDIQLDEYTFEFLTDTDEQTQKYYKGLYLGKLKRCKKLSEKTYIINQALSKGIKIHQNGGLIAKATRESYNCVDEETEILTADGWKYYNEISIGEKVLSYNMQTGLMEWDVVKDIHIYVADNIEVIEFSQPNFSAIATHNHRWVAYDKDTKEVVIKTTDELQSGRYEIFNVSCDLLKFGKYGIVSAYVNGRVKVKQGRETTTNLVWCPTTRNSTWIARRNNTMYVTKNSPIQGCLCGDTCTVQTKEYGLTHIKDVVDKDLTIWDGDSFVKASCVYSGKKQLVKITFEDGRIIGCSPNHRFLIHEFDGTQKFYSAKELYHQLHQNIVVSNTIRNYCCISEEDFPVMPSSDSNKYSFSMITDKYELGYILGWWYNSGIINKFGDCVWVFSKEKLKKLSFVHLMLERYFSFHTVHYNGHESVAEMSCIIVDSESLGKQAEFIRGHIPNIVSKSKQATRGFIHACADTIGEYTSKGVRIRNNDTMEDTLLSVLQVLLSNFGIYSHLNTWEDTLCIPNMTAFQSFIIQGNVHLDMDEVYSVKIKSIEITNEYVDMYDIVNSESHKFVANGVVTHNSAADITKKAMLNIATNERLKELGAEMVLTIHDETMTSVPKENAYEAAKIIEKCSIDAGEGLGAPLRCDIAISDRWEGQQYTFDSEHNLVPLKEDAV